MKELTCGQILNKLLFHTAAHTHTHPFNDPFSRTTRVGRYQKGKTNLDFTEARDSEWQWRQLGICKSAPRSRQITTPAPHHSVFCRPDALPAAQPTADDTQLFLSFLPTHFDSSIDHLHNALDQISSWMTANLLTLNSSKTEFLLIGLSKQLVKISNSSLAATHSARNLGFIFDEPVSALVKHN